MMQNRTRGILLGVFAAVLLSYFMLAFVRYDHDKHGADSHPYCESALRRLATCNHEHLGDPEKLCRGISDDDDYEPLARCAAKTSCLDFAECALPEISKLPD
jgi:hypothetical protein